MRRLVCRCTACHDYRRCAAARENAPPFDQRQLFWPVDEDTIGRFVGDASSARRGLTGIRVAVPVEALETRLAGLPEGVTVEAGRIEVRFADAKEAVARLIALAQALTGDYELVGKGERSSG